MTRLTSSRVMTGSCAVCQAAATQCCSSCRTTFYCNRDHQRQHWKVHKTQCVAYRLQESPGLGRHLVATRDIRPGEVIIREVPLVVGPKVASAVLCLGCHRRLDADHELWHRCGACGWPLCGEECETAAPHVAECKVMADRKYRASIGPQVPGKKEPAYCCITPLRCLLLRDRHPGKYRTLLELQSHLKERRNTPLYKIFRINVVGFIQEALGMRDFDEETILNVAAILDTNSFEIRHEEDGVKVRGLYPMAAMMAHDCRPNTKHAFCGAENMMMVTATTPIARGESITTTYTHTLWGTMTRRAHLLAAKCFECTCVRCSDPTEFGTFLGAVVCSRCGHGKLLSSAPLDAAASWKCQECPHHIPARQVSWGNEAIHREVADLDKTRPDLLEGFLDKYRDVLHSTNGHALQIKHLLTEIYGNKENYRLPDLTDKQLERKIELCQELLEVLDILEPGWTRLRGTLLYSLQEAMVVQAKKDFNSEKITKQGAQELMKETMTMLQEATEILKTEPDLAEKLPAKMAALADQLEFD